MLTELGFAPAIEFHHDGFEFNDGTKPSHDFDLEGRRRQYRGAVVVYMERDPRDVLVSLYHQITGRFRKFFEYEGDVSSFIRDDYFGAYPLRDFRLMWSELCDEGLALRVTYEDCHRDSSAVLRTVIEHYGLDADDASIAVAVKNSSWENMRSIEERGDFPEKWLRPRDGYFKTRRGKAGGFRDALPGADIAYLNAIFGLE